MITEERNGTVVGSRWSPRFAHGLALLLAVAGVGAQIRRPLAPDLGPMPDPGGWFDDAYLATASAYRSPLYVLALSVLLIRLAVPLAAAFTPLGRRLTGALVARVGVRRPARAATAVVLAIAVLTDLLVLPLSFWSGYVHDGRYGLRTSTLGGWLRDWGIAKGVTWVGVVVLVLGGYTLARRLPRVWPPVAAVAAGALTAVVVFLGPVVLEPLQFRTTPLAEGPVRAEVESVLERTGIVVGRIVVADASRRTTRQNAYVSGLGRSRRIVLYDTLVDNRAPEEVGLILAHELGHHRNADLPRGVLFSFTGTALAAYLLAAFARRRARDGHQAQVWDPRGAAAMLAVVIVMNLAAAPVQQAASRRAEAAADLAALELTSDPATFLAMNEGLTRNNLGMPRPPRWAYLLWSSHPPPVSRLEMGERWPLSGAGEGPGA